MSPGAVGAPPLVYAPLGASSSPLALLVVGVPLAVLLLVLVLVACVTACFLQREGGTFVCVVGPLVLAATARRATRVCSVRRTIGALVITLDGNALESAFAPITVACALRIGMAWRARSTTRVLGACPLFHELATRNARYGNLSKS